MTVGIALLIFGGILSVLLLARLILGDGAKDQAKDTILDALGHIEERQSRIELSLKSLGENTMGAIDQAITAIQTGVADIVKAADANTLAANDATTAINDFIAQSKAGQVATPAQLAALADASAAIEGGAKRISDSAAILDTAAKAADPGPQPLGPGPLTVDNVSVSLSLSTAPSAVVNARETGYVGVISAASANAPIASVSPASGNGAGPVAFTITAASIGSTSVQITDDHGGSVIVSVTVVA
jgi:hypothetical protein